MEDKKIIPPLSLNEEAEESLSPAAKESNNLFDPARLRLSQNFAESAGVKKMLLTVPVRKPGRQDFVRVHSEESYRLTTAVLELKEERETYLVEPSLWEALAGEIIPKTLFTTINRQGVLSLWPIRLPGEDGRHDEWNRTALEAAQMAQKYWVRVSANMSLGSNDVHRALGELPEPEWPALSFGEILKLAFKGHYITALDHPVIRRLQGEL